MLIKDNIEGVSSQFFRRNMDSICCKEKAQTQKNLIYIKFFMIKIHP